MCLYTYNKEPKVADHDIVCYKVLLKSEWIENFLFFKRRKHNYFTPVTFTRVTPKGIMYAKGDSTVLKLNDEDISMLWEVIIEKAFNEPVEEKAVYVVSSGYIHTFKNLNDAKSLINHSAVSPYGYKEINIIRCIIPCGTKYYEGGTEVSYLGITGSKSYASKKIKFDKRVKISYL